MAADAILNFEKNVNISGYQINFDGQMHHGHAYGEDRSYYQLQDPYSVATSKFLC